MLQPDKQYERLALLLCYLGALTVTGKTRTAKWTLAIPNLVMRKLYAERLLELTFPTPSTRDAAQDAADLLFAQGDIAPLCDFVEQHYFPIYDNRDYKDFNELTLKTLFLALLYHTNLYIMDSEPALQRTYADLTMILRPEMRHYSVYDLLLEFKYVPLKDVRVGKQAVTGQELREMLEADIAALETVQEKMGEAEAQLQRYQQTLQQKYGAALKLRTFALVSVGLERLIWKAV
ncbi:MAG: PD-(D/E)XK nuclease domain-containing protein [Caldilineaceae bacterium]|nr:PD-(D/E)XK nuclease domain-containing protein [Caldilineaceae bacterium]